MPLELRPAYGRYNAALADAVNDWNLDRDFQDVYSRQFTCRSEIEHRVFISHVIFWYDCGSKCGALALCPNEVDRCDQINANIDVLALRISVARYTVRPLTPKTITQKDYAMALELAEEFTTIKNNFKNAAPGGLQA